MWKKTNEDGKVNFTEGLIQEKEDRVLKVKS